MTCHCSPPLTRRTLRYVDIVRETMAAARLGPKAPAKAAGAAGAAAGGPSDQAKMEMQLGLDVEDLAAQLAEQLAFPAAATEPLLARLRAVVAPP